MANEMIWTTQSGFLSNGTLNEEYQRAAQPLAKFRQFCSIKGALGKNKGESVNWLKVSNIGTYGGTLIETNTMHESDQPLAWGTLSVDELGNSVPFTFKIETLSEFDIRQIIKEGLLDDTWKCIDGLVERQFNATLLRHVGTATNGFVLTTNGTTTATNTSIFNSYHLRKMVLALKTRNVPGYTKLGGDYGLIGSHECIESFEGAVEGVNQNIESGYTKILNGETNRYYGTRFVEDGFASRFVYNSTARTATSIINNTAPGAGYSSGSWTGGSGTPSSGPAYLFGSPTVMEAVAVPEEIRMKIVTDYGRSQGLAWYALLGFKIMWDTSGGADTRIIKWDSA